jgi:superfamily II DNA/RNA helicase
MNYDLPRDKANYIHRIGRGGRFGRKAVAINLITQWDAPVVAEIERYYATEIREMPDNVEDFM